MLLYTFAFNRHLIQSSYSRIFKVCWATITLFCFIYLLFCLFHCFFYSCVGVESTLDWSKFSQTGSSPDSYTATICFFFFFSIQY